MTRLYVCRDCVLREFVLGVGLFFEITCFDTVDVALVLLRVYGYCLYVEFSTGTKYSNCNLTWNYKINYNNNIYLKSLAKVMFI